MSTPTVGKAEQAGESASLTLLARVGLVAYGIVHLVIGGLALQIAWGASAGSSADVSGALRTVADQPLGKIVLLLGAVGLGALALWQASEVIWGYRELHGLKRIQKQISSGAKAVIFAALGISAASVALGLGSSSSQSQQQATSGVLAWPGGSVIVVGAGLLILAVGVITVIKGLRKSFAEEIDTSSMSKVGREFVLRVGQLGYVAKGLALGVVGVLLGNATLIFRRQEAPGLDGALHMIVAQPFGRILLTAMAVGFAVFGLFALLQSRYRRM